MFAKLVTRQTRNTLGVCATALCLAASNPGAAWPQEFTEAELFIELNDTDGDLGLHASIDGGPYVRLEVEDPLERIILVLSARGNMTKQGMTQFFLESAEPSFDQLAPAKFFKRFPEGTYEIEGLTAKGKAFEGASELSHVLAARPENIEVNGMAAAEDCDAPLPHVNAPVVVDWDPVTTSHPEIGESGPVEIVRYQFFVEQGDVKFAVDLPPTVTEFEVPEAITATGGTFKYEIIARTADLNNTAVETCFIVE